MTMICVMVRYPHEHKIQEVVGAISYTYARISYRITPHSLINKLSDEQPSQTTNIFIILLKSKMENLHHTPRRSSRRAAFVATARLTEMLTPARRGGRRDVNATARSHGDEAAADETVPNGSEFRDEDSLSSVESSEADEVECPICLEDIVTADIATIDGCDHVFCLDCLTQWSETNNICPLCRTRFNTIESSGVLQRVPDRRPAIALNLVGVFNLEEVGGEGEDNLRNPFAVMLRQMLELQEVQRQRNEEQLQQMRQETEERRQQMEVRQQQMHEEMNDRQLMQALRMNSRQIELNNRRIEQDNRQIEQDNRESQARLRELRLRQEQQHGGEAERAPEGIVQQNINADVGVAEPPAEVAELNADFARVMDTLRSLL